MHFETIPLTLSHPPNTESGGYAPVILCDLTSGAQLMNEATLIQ